MDDVYLTLQSEFLDEARDRLGEMEDCLNDAYTGQTDGAEALIKLRREAHTLKGMGNAFGFPLITVLTHRLEDYMSHLSEPTAEHSKDIQYFIDRTWDVVRRGENPSDSETREVLRALPVFRSHQNINADELDTEILLVCDSQTIARKIGNDLTAYGFRIINVSNALDALSMAVSMHPDIIITSGVLKGLNGFDLVRALSAMHATKHVPLAVFTSFDAEHPEVMSLASSIPVVHLGPDVSDELTLALTNLEYQTLAPSHVDRAS
ncbi:MAG: Hpt domain-containing protein [Magnetovibrio sp.]|nr:Hpt domain-containing protein [Magnetovibrio sp.]